jgi:hypothetical protein
MGVKLGLSQITTLKPTYALYFHTQGQLPLFFAERDALHVLYMGVEGVCCLYIAFFVYLCLFMFMCRNVSSFLFSLLCSMSLILLILSFSDVCTQNQASCQYFAHSR